MSGLFRIKICGITTVEDTKMVASSGADAIGFNFSDRSSRCVDVNMAKRMSEAVAGRLLRVGVFVNQPPEEVNRIGVEAQLDAVQLHGDESVRYLAEVQLPAIKALPFGRDGIQPLLDYWRDAQVVHAVCVDPRPSATARGLMGLLIDASVDGQYGGTGSAIDWDRLAGHSAELKAIPWALAGGLNPDNVGEAIQKLKPHGVDVASGVESAPGIKDEQKSVRFVSAATHAWTLCAKK